jgi:prepilin-type N-terminal cleavage/methylation domain-containing protein
MNAPKRSLRSPKGFSLIEMLAVLSIVSVVMVSVSIRWGSVYRKARLTATIERVISFDFKARRHAMQQNRRGRLLYDLDDNRMIKSSRWVDGTEKMASTEIDKLSLLERFRTSQNESSDGIIQLQVSNLGSTPTYCIEIDQGGERRWIVFAGRTGQAEVYEDQQQADEFFAALEVAGGTGS